MKVFISFSAGVIFSIGLVISGMTNPNVVLGFLDLFGAWDMRLLFVMAGAVAVNIVFFRMILKRQKPFLSAGFSLPSKKDLDGKLILGSAIFGVGWGVLGICPGPGIVNLATFDPLFIVFVSSMLVGMFAHRAALERKKKP